MGQLLSLHFEKGLFYALAQSITDVVSETTSNKYVSQVSKRSRDAKEKFTEFDVGLIERENCLLEFEYINIYFDDFQREDLREYPGFFAFDIMSEFIGFHYYHHSLDARAFIQRVLEPIRSLAPQDIRLYGLSTAIARSEGPEAFAFGVSHSALDYEQVLKDGRWLAELHKSEPAFFDKKLRDVFELNLVTDLHLNTALRDGSKFIDLITSEKLGDLSDAIVPGVFVWSLAPSEVAGARLRLKKENLLV